MAYNSKYALRLLRAAAVSLGALLLPPQKSLAAEPNDLNLLPRLEQFIEKPSPEEPSNERGSGTTDEQKTPKHHNKKQEDRHNQ